MSRPNSPLARRSRFPVSLSARWRLAATRGGSSASRSASAGTPTLATTSTCPSTTPGRLREVTGDEEHAGLILDLCERVAQGRLDTWDCPWKLGQVLRGGLTVVPAVNLAAEQKAQLQQKPAVSGAKYTGEPISVNLKDVDLKDFFRLIHEISGLNVVLDPLVHGNLTIVLDDVPWDQALDIVLKNNDLSRQLDGNVLRIATVETLRKEAENRRAQIDAEAAQTRRRSANVSCVRRSGYYFTNRSAILRFAVRVTHAPRKIRFQPLVRLYWAGLSPAEFQ